MEGNEITNIGVLGASGTGTSVAIKDTDIKLGSKDSIYEFYYNMATSILHLTSKGRSFRVRVWTKNAVYRLTSYADMLTVDASSFLSANDQLSRELTESAHVRCEAGLDWNMVNQYFCSEGYKMLYADSDGAIMGRRTKCADGEFLFMFCVRLICNTVEHSQLMYFPVDMIKNMFKDSDDLKTVAGDNTELTDSKDYKIVYDSLRGLLYLKSYRSDIIVDVGNKFKLSDALKISLTWKPVVLCCSAREKYELESSYGLGTSDIGKWPDVVLRYFHDGFATLYTSEFVHILGCRVSGTDGESLVIHVAMSNADIITSQVTLLYPVSVIARFIEEGEV